MLEFDEFICVKDCSRLFPPFQGQINKLIKGSLSIVDGNQQGKEIIPCLVYVTLVLVSDAREVGQVVL